MKMKFIQKFCLLALIVFVLAIHNRAQVESFGHLRKFSVKFYKNKTESAKDANKEAKEKIRLDQIRNREQEIENKRQEIYKGLLLNRVYGSILKDFYNRF